MATTNLLPTEDSEHIYIVYKSLKLMVWQDKWIISEEHLMLSYRNFLLQSVATY